MLLIPLNQLREALYSKENNHDSQNTPASREWDSPFIVIFSLIFVLSFIALLSMENDPPSGHPEYPPCSWPLVNAVRAVRAVLPGKVPQGFW